MEPIEFLTWVVISVFALTALITLGGLVDSLKMIQVKDEYLHKLFIVLILEIIAVCIPLSAEAIKDSRCNKDCMLERIKMLDPSSSLAKDILELRNTFQGIFVTPEYSVEISFADFKSPHEARVCPQSPLYLANVMVFSEAREGGTFVIAFHPEPHLCSESDIYQIEINKQWATQEFDLTDVTQKIKGWGRVIPPTPGLYNGG